MWSVEENYQKQLFDLNELDRGFLVVFFNRPHDTPQTSYVYHVYIFILIRFHILHCFVIITTVSCLRCASYFILMLFFYCAPFVKVCAIVQHTYEAAALYIPSPQKKIYTSLPTPLDCKEVSF